ncbi:hypothetical protein GQ55_4G105500 [Panicum hallii var. hallii]|uniref:Uncharacterized protein n=1 Tax=Panicum hallii var. hallii TaxID=1504633 RepID=A0A2T7DXA3_9POAL|nr:hypothetical protein GQ55_4G105500 [Panicum hallii var. hallii]
MQRVGLRDNARPGRVHRPSASLRWRVQLCKTARDIKQQDGTVKINNQGGCVEFNSRGGLAAGA